MDVKIDKETIIKHRFWFSLPCIALCVLIGWGCEVRLRGMAKSKFDAANVIKTNLENLAKNPDRRSPDWITEAGKRKTESDKERERLWYISFDAQNDVLPTRRVPDQPQEKDKALEPKPLQALRQPLITWPRNPDPNKDPVEVWKTRNKDVLERDGMAGFSLYQDPSLDNPDASKVLDFGEELYIIPKQYVDEFPNQYEAIAKLLTWYNPRSGEGAILTSGGDYKAHVFDAL